MSEQSGATAATVAVLDVGKTNVKLSALTADGEIVESLSVPNTVMPGPPWQHHDLEGLSDWAFASLRELTHRHALRAVVASGHGVGGVLVGDDPDETSTLPMIDYEQDPPHDITRGYVPLSGSFLDRGSNIMLKATHHARQMYWMQQADPEAFARARWYLGLPQYWAWRLCGIAASETSMLSAQSHLWNVVEKGWTPIVHSQGWLHLMPPFRHAWEKLGVVRPELARRHGLPHDLAVLAGGHDSSLNLYRYQAAGMPDVCLISSGTWIVGMCAATPLERVDPRRGMVLNSDVTGRLVGGSLTMGGREFSLVAGEQPEAAGARPDLVGALVARGTYAIPSFGSDDGLFPGSAGRGHFVGAPPASPQERKALAVLYAALLAAECIDALGTHPQVALDGTFLRDPLYASIVAALRPQSATYYNTNNYGTASGAALLAGHETRRAPAPISLKTPQPYPGDRAALAAYARRWRELAFRSTSIETA
jgi:sugar (pentulose or hexulose) kinase